MADPTDQAPPPDNTGQHAASVPFIHPIGSKQFVDPVDIGRKATISISTELTIISINGDQANFHATTKHVDTPDPPKQTGIPGATAHLSEEQKKWIQRIVPVSTLLLMGLLGGAIFKLYTLKMYPLVVILALLSLGILLYLGYTSSQWFGWMGLSGYTKPSDKFDRPKTLWDWLTLLIIPVVLAIATIVFSVQQSAASLTASNNQYTNDKNIAATRYVTDQQLAGTQQAVTALQNYLDRMSDLLVNQNLHTYSLQGDDVRNLARARTLSILSTLSEGNKIFLVKFLYFGGLIKRQNPTLMKKVIDPVVNLSTADLSNIDLDGFDLRNADLAGVILRGANLQKTHLSTAYLSQANLSNAHLENATLCYALTTDGINVVNLSGAGLSNAHLNGADLIGAVLDGAHLDGANLGSTDQVCPDELQLQPGTKLKGADLTNASLKNVVLTNANLTGVKLVNADLSGANLTNADLTNANLHGASLTGTTLMNVTWSNTTCRDGTNSNTNGDNSCVNH